MKVRVDGVTYPSKKVALKEKHLEMVCCDGSESYRAADAYAAIMEGYTDIDTRKEYYGHL